MENVHILQIIAQICALIGAQDSQRQTENGPEMDDMVICPVVGTQFMDLGMAVVASGNNIGGFCRHDLPILEAAIFQPLLFKSRLEESTTAATAVVVGAVGNHINEILLTHRSPYGIPQVIGDFIPIALSDDLARVLKGEFNLQVLVPVGVWLQLPLPDPFCIVFINVFNLKIVLDPEFFQSGPD